MGCASVQQNSVLNNFKTSDGFTCDHISTRDAETITIVTLCRDERDDGKVVVASSNTVSSVAFADILQWMGNLGMGVVTPLLIGL